METSSPPVVKSTFVTAVAWVFIALAGFATLISALQNIMIYIFFPVEQMHGAMAQAREQQQMPAYYWFIFEHVREIFAGFLLLTSLVLVASIGLLRRYNWARILFVWLLALGVIWNVAGIAWPWIFFHTMPQPPQTAPIHAQFQALATGIGIFSAIISLGTAVLFVWIVKRLMSSAIKTEFMNRAA